MNFDALMGQSPGAKRRQESALNRFKIFFEQLASYGLQVAGTPFPDHYEFSARDLDAFSDKPLLITHKDAVKMSDFAREVIEEVKGTTTASRV